MNEPIKTDPEISSNDQKLPKRKRPYSPPQLVYYGDVREMTLGGSPGALDSSTTQPTNPFN